MTKVKDSLREVEEKSARADRIFTLILAIMVAVAFTVCILFSYVYFLVKIDGVSMENTFYTGEALIVDGKASYTYGDVVIIDKGDHLVIKRVIAMEGDVVRIEDGKVYLTKNGETEKRLIENYIKEQNSTYTSGQTEWTIGKGQVFYLGDNRTQSRDSRQDGCCRKEKILGVVSDNAIKLKGFTTWLFSIFGGNTTIE